LAVIRIGGLVRIPSEMQPRRVAVVGSGISGLTAAHTLHASGHQVRLFESEPTLGGHATTVEVGPDRLPVDIGFIVYNEVTYPRFIGLLAELGVPTQPSDMSMGVACGAHGIEWSTRGLKGVFARPMQLALPSHYRMLGDLFRFYRDARSLLDTDTTTGMTLDEYLDDRGFVPSFARHFLVPLTAAVWSTAPDEIGTFPVDYLLRFLDHHGLIGYGRNLEWRTISGGSREYVRRIAERLGPGAISLGDPVRAVVRDENGVLILPTHQPAERFDAVVMATHADTSLRLLRDADPDEQAALGGFDYSDNRVILHTDAGILPTKPNAWASWNVDMGSCAAPGDALTMTYHMNRLQSLESATQVSVSLNPPAGRIRDEQVLLERAWSHPLYTFRTLRAQEAMGGLQGHRATWHAGAHLGYGFHEDGCRAGYEAAESILARWTAIDGGAEEERAA
jgi:predicted NAD/FAD-binding protein